MGDGKSGGLVPDAVWKTPLPLNGALGCLRALSVTSIAAHYTIVYAKVMLGMPPSPSPAMKTAMNDFFSHERDDKAVRSPILTEQIISLISAAADFDLDLGRTS
ncbi:MULTISPECIES: hypothetical protein [Rhizobium]|uniref:hypothetical protein n=1 Tax=Rhizobium TaxID=379 RepID=UPI0012605BFC|nr:MULTISPECIES: hypothetical protein [Rhizobium]